MTQETRRPSPPTGARLDTAFDRYLGEWLFEAGPQDVPERVLDRAFAQAATERRVRPLPGVLGRLAAAEGPGWLLPQSLRPVATTWLALVALLIALIAIALAGADRDLGIGMLRNGLIAFESEGDVWVARQDGGGIRRLTDTTATETNPTWSPDGTRLAFWAAALPSVTIHVVDPDGRLLHVLEPPADLSFPVRGGALAWSPDGTSIVAPARGTRKDGSRLIVGIPEVVLLEVASAKGRRLDPGDELLRAQSFGFTADGRALGLELAAYDTADGPGVGLALADLGSDEVDLLLADVWLGGMTFTPSGDDVVLHVETIRSRDARLPTAGRSDTDIARVDLATGAMTTIVSGPTMDLAPSVSPDGALVAFSRAPGVTAAAQYMPDASGRTALRVANVPNGENFWVTEPTELYVVPIEGGEPRLVGEGLWPGSVWSPDGSRLLAQTTDGQHHVVINVADPTDRIEIPSPGNVSWMSWQQVGSQPAT
jgi:dipeptidyl aminopeptidase/acylaminoacyl peptidase